MPFPWYVKSFVVAQWLRSQVVQSALKLEWPPSPTLLVRESLAGQYEYPKSVYYGGTQPEFECRRAQIFYSSNAREYSSTLHLDIHTGFGEYGITEIAPDEDAGNETLLHLRSLFPDKSGQVYVVSPTTGSGGTLKTHENFSRVLCDRSPFMKSCNSATAEIGAYTQITG